MEDCQHRLKREPISSVYREPGFDGLIGGDAAKTLYQLLYSPIFVQGPF
jgi:hypothetical protein